MNRKHSFRTHLTTGGGTSATFSKRGSRASAAPIQPIRWLSLAALAASASFGCAFEMDEPITTEGEQLSMEQRARLAQRWAPIHYQDVDQTGSHALDGAADYITRYDFDGDLDGRNNWENAARSAYPRSAHAYFSVVETSTHFYLTYLFFHPRDWVDWFFETEHENDAEGVLLTVARDDSEFGTLKSAITVAHTNFFSYVPRGSDWRNGAETVDGTLQMQTFEGVPHPVTAQEAKGHGLKARPYYDIRGGDGVVYYPSLTRAEVPEHPNDRHVKYKLVDIFEPGGMWDQRNNPSLFAHEGTFAGNGRGGCGSGTVGCTNNAAHAPWAWDDGNDGPGRGALAFDPAGLTANYFKIPERHSKSYTANGYLAPIEDSTL